MSLVAKLWGRVMQAVILASGLWVVVADDGPNWVAVVFVLALLVTLVEFSVQWLIERRRERRP